MVCNRFSSVVGLSSVCSKIGSGATPRGGSNVYLEHGIFALIRSQNVYNEGFNKEGLAYINEEHADELRNVEVQSGDVLLNITGDSVARCCQVVDDVLPARVNQHVAIIRPDADQLDPRYLRYYLTSPQMQKQMLSWAGSGGTRNALTKGMIESFQIPVPENIEQQRVIAGVLGSLDDKIELNQRMNETLEAMARAIFKSWFVDFDPVRAKAEGRKPVGMSEDIAKLFPDSFEDSEPGEIPNGWKAGVVGDSFRVTMGQSPPGTTYNERGEGIPFFQGRRDFGFRYPAARVYCTAPTRFAEANDTLVSVRAPVGDINMAKQRCCVGRGVAAVRHKSGSRSYTYYMMHHLGDIFSRFEAEGTVFGSITKDGFKKMECITPAGEIIDAFEKLAFPTDQRIETNEKQSETLASIRDALLPKLLSGEIRVKASV
ncbi:MAG: hypothetical protein AMJ75_01365 [Phycisphaerae bacterium SM1_79]|nr:MAG: hypothetical protein AMJ75_01365 [Phycisphaerae bacterium SM1_79]